MYSAAASEGGNEELLVGSTSIGERVLGTPDLTAWRSGVMALGIVGGVL